MVRRSLQFRGISRRLSSALTIFLFAAHSNGQTYDREKIWEKEIGAFAEIDRTARHNAQEELRWRHFVNE